MAGDHRQVDAGALGDLSDRAQLSLLRQADEQREALGVSDRALNSFGQSRPSSPLQQRPEGFPLSPLFTCAMVQL